MALAVSRKLVRNALKTKKCIAPNSAFTSNPPVVVPAVHFHYQSIFQFHLQSRHLLEALQKSRPSNDDLNELNLRIPDDLRRLKAGSLKWLFSAWPTPKKSLSVASEVQSFLGGSPRESQSSQEGQKKNGRNKKSVTPADEEHLHKIVDYLKANNVAIKRLMNLPWLLTSDPVVLDEAVKRVQEILGLDSFQVALAFVNTDNHKLKEVASFWRHEQPELAKEAALLTTYARALPKFTNRIDFLSYHLQCPKEDVADMMAKVARLMTRPLPLVKSVLFVLLEGGVKPEYIVHDPQVFNHGANGMRSRLKIMHNADITDVKPWTFKCSLSLFERYVLQHLAEKKLMGDHENISGFLQERLMCDKQSIDQIFVKVPHLKVINVTKLNDIIEWLLSKGFSREQILEGPRILTCSVITISERFNEVMEYQDPRRNLSILYTNGTHYRAILRRLRKNTQTKTQNNA